MTAPLSAGTRVTLTGTATGRANLVGREIVRIDGDTMGAHAVYAFDRSALQVVVPPEPQWTVGDAVRIDEDTYTLERLLDTRSDTWRCASDGRAISKAFIQRAWSEGRVRVLYCQNQEDGE
jgi:hypothetical protein